MLILPNFSCQEVVTSRRCFQCLIIELFQLRAGNVEMRKMQPDKNLCPQSAEQFYGPEYNHPLRAVNQSLDGFTGQLHEALLTWFFPFPVAHWVFFFTDQHPLQGHGSARVLSAGHNKHLHLQLRGSRNRVSQESESITLQKQVILSTELASFLRFCIVYGKSTAVVKKRNTGLSPK